MVLPPTPEEALIDSEERGAVSWRNVEYERDRDRSRFNHFIPNYLAPLLKGAVETCSVGCGSGRDVEMLRALGFEAYGFDPGGRVMYFEDRAQDIRDFLRVGLAEDLPFGDKKFDVVYALEVIEHVGCVDFGTQVTDKTHAARLAFMTACLDMTKSGGSLILTSSNRLCPVDVGHRHRYTALGRWFSARTGLGLSVPWSRENFLWSAGNVREALAQTRYAGRCSVELLPMKNYARATSGKGLKAFLARAWLSTVDALSLGNTPLCPLLSVRIRLD